MPTVLAYDITLVTLSSALRSSLDIIALVTLSWVDRSMATLLLTICFSASFRFRDTWALLPVTVVLMPFVLLGSLLSFMFFLSGVFDLSLLLLLGRLCELP